MGQDRGLANVKLTRSSPPLNPVDNLTLRIRQTNIRNEVTLPAFSDTAEQATSRKQREGKIPQEAKAGGNASDMLPWGRVIGRYGCQ